MCDARIQNNTKQKYSNKVLHHHTYHGNRIQGALTKNVDDSHKWEWETETEFQEWSENNNATEKKQL